MDEARGDIIGQSKLLVASARAALIQFLRIELDVATTMLEAARVTEDRKVRERRRYRAQQAFDTVAHHLSATGTETRLPRESRAEFAAALDRLRQGLAERP